MQEVLDAKTVREGLQATRAMLKAVVDNARADAEGRGKAGVVKPRVLVLDTSEERQGVGEELSREGFVALEVRRSVGGSGAEREVRHYEPAVLVIVETDPLERSIDLIRYLRSRVDLLRLPIVFLTTQRLSCVKAYYAGANRCLSYHAAPEQLVAEVRKLVPNL